MYQRVYFIVAMIRRGNYAPVIIFISSMIHPSLIRWSRSVFETLVNFVKQYNIHAI